MPQAVILDLRIPLLDAYGKQEGRPLAFIIKAMDTIHLSVYDGMTGDLVKISFVMEPSIPVPEWLTSCSRYLMNKMIIRRSVFCFVVTAVSTSPHVFISSVKEKHNYVIG